MEYRQNGIIIKITGGLYTVRLDQGNDPLANRAVECRARGNFRHEGLTPLVGDRVTVQYDDGSYTVAENGEIHPHADRAGLMIAEIHDRKNALIRPPLANLDIMLVVLAAAKPAPDIPTIDKLLCILEHNRITPVMIIGKCELDPENAKIMSDIYTSIGYRVFTLSCHSGEGLPAFAQYAHTELRGRTVGIAGASGVGKSTLLGTVFPDLKGQSGDAPVAGDISHKIGRGKNTTRHTELFPLPDDGVSYTPTGYIADTAGFSLLDFQRFDFFTLEDLPHTFPEFAPHLGGCRYTDCTHLCEEGCAVVDALRRGEIQPSRHEAYRSLYAVLKEKHAWDKKN